jgi:hypothetical protein
MVGDTSLFTIHLLGANGEVMDYNDERKPLLWWHRELDLLFLALLIPIPINAIEI